MKRTKDKITALFNAITFAEAGEHESAKKYLDEMSEPSRAEATKLPKGVIAAATDQKGLKEKLEDHMAAVAFAEAGEYQLAESISRAEPQPRTVLLVIEGDSPDADAFSYAMSLCKRMNLEMDILQVVGSLPSQTRRESSSWDRDRAAERVQALSRQLEQGGIPFKTTVRRGDVNELLYDYAKIHKDVFMVVYDSPRAKENSADSKVWQRIVDSISRRLSIPLVTVVGKQPVGQPS
jgi:hypothetical protein